MLSAFIVSVHSYPAFPTGVRTGTPLARRFRSSRTMKRSSQCSNAYTGYGPNCLTHVNPPLSWGMDYVFILLFNTNNRSWRFIQSLKRESIPAHIDTFILMYLLYLKSLQGRQL